MGQFAGDKHNLRRSDEMARCPIESFIEGKELPFGDANRLISDQTCEDNARASRAKQDIAYYCFCGGISRKTSMLDVCREHTQGAGLFGSDRLKT